MPSFLKTPVSTCASMTEEWTSQPESLGSCASASSATGLVAAEMDSAMKHLVGVQAGVVVAETLDLELLDRLDDELRQDVQVVRQTGERLERGEQGCGRGAEQGSGLAGDDGAVGQLDGGRRRTGLICAPECGGGDRTVRSGYVRLIHQQLELAHAALVAETHADIAERLIVAADDLLAGGPRGRHRRR